MAAVFISHIHEEKDQALALSWLVRERLNFRTFLTSDY